MTARGADGQVASDRQLVFPGGVLSVRAARVVAAERIGRAQAILRPSPPGRVGKCRRFGRKRVDCKIMLRGYGCWEVASVRLRASTGLPYVRAYDNVLDGVCRFRR